MCIGLGVMGTGLSGNLVWIKLSVMLQDVYQSGCSGNWVWIRLGVMGVSVYHLKPRVYILQGVIGTVSTPIKMRWELGVYQTTFNGKRV